MEQRRHGVLGRRCQGQGVVVTKGRAMGERRRARRRRAASLPFPPRTGDRRAHEIIKQKQELAACRNELDAVESYTGVRAMGTKKDSQGCRRSTLKSDFFFPLGPLDQGW